MELDAVRTFVAAARLGSFQEAATELAITQQAVSKRIAALERELDVRLFTRGARGAQPSIDGQAFLPHATALLQAAERAVASVRPGSRTLRVDVITMKSQPKMLLRGFHEAHPDVGLDVVTLFDGDSAIAAVQAGTIDATFRYVARDRRLPAGVEAARVLDEPLDLMVGPRHALATARSTTLARLAGHRIWIPGIVPGVEWGVYYERLAAEFGLAIDSVGPNFGTDHLMDVIAGSSDVATFLGDRTRLAWPAGHDLRRIPVLDPTPAYPHSLVWRSDNRHPGLRALRRHLAARRAPDRDDRFWTPETLDTVDSVDALDRPDTVDAWDRPGTVDA
ncbi:LysR family transcriptional regulator [Catenulispora yoronensis]|uniref:LysR family transcriptional regulator n=1 Tax=Catenulispora yoronensis TaxID=450799 RepID=A0ABN2VGT4_9ACTN